MAGAEEPDPAEAFRQRFTQELDAVDLSKSSSTRFDALRDVLADRLELSPDEIYIAGASTRASNLPIRLRQGRARDRHFILGVGALGEDNRSGGVAAIINTMASRNYDAIALARRDGSGWSMTDIATSGNNDVVARIQEVFPDAELHQAPTAAADEGPGLGASRFPTAGDFARFRPRTEGSEGLLAGFLEHAAGRGVDIDASVAADLVTTMLSSQFLLFAGPSGTGKSTAARLVASFFCPPESVAVVEARRQWVGQEDLVGYYSVMAGTYAATPETFILIDLATAAVTDGEPEDQVAPSLIVEEANLSPIEGYLGPAVHGLSGLSTPFLRWSLHGQVDPVVPDGGDPVPGEVVLGPFPRLLGTINVDATAMAPARKVVARSAVMLMEPSTDLTAESIQDLVRIGLGGDADDSSHGGGVGFLGDPMSALRATDRIDALSDRLVSLLGQVSAGDNLVSRRDILRCLSYMAAFEVVVGASELALTLGAENAVLHFVLPGLTAEQFAVALRSLSEVAIAEPASERDQLGGLLGPRLDRLQVAAAGDFAGSVDFWTSLS